MIGMGGRCLGHPAMPVPDGLLPSHVAAQGVGMARLGGPGHIGPACRRVSTIAMSTIAMSTIGVTTLGVGTLGMRIMGMTLIGMSDIRLCDIRMRSVCGARLRRTGFCRNCITGSVCAGCLCSRGILAGRTGPGCAGLHRGAGRSGNIGTLHFVPGVVIDAGRFLPACADPVGLRPPERLRPGCPLGYLVSCHHTPPLALGCRCPASAS